MTFAADYAMSRYGGIAYGVRGPAVYASALSESVTGADNEGAIAVCNPVISELATGSDLLNVIMQVQAFIAGQIAALDYSISSLFRPVNIFDLDKEGRNAAPVAEKRAGAVDANDAAKIKSDSRQVVANADTRSSTAKDNRNFKI